MFHDVELRYDQDWIREIPSFVIVALLASVNQTLTQNLTCGTSWVRLSAHSTTANVGSIDLDNKKKTSNEYISM